MYACFQEHCYQVISSHPVALWHNMLCCAVLCCAVLCWQCHAVWHPRKPCKNCVHISSGHVLFKQHLYLYVSEFFILQLYWYSAVVRCVIGWSCNKIGYLQHQAEESVSCIGNQEMAIKKDQSSRKSWANVTGRKASHTNTTTCTSGQTAAVEIHLSCGQVYYTIDRYTNTCV